MKYISLLLALCFMAFGIQAQSGWTRKKKSYFIKTSFNLFSSDKYYNPDGEKLITARFRQQSISVYGEYGISDRLNVIVNFPLLKINSFETSEPVTGIGDLKVEFKYSLLTKNIPLTFGVAPEFPTGSANKYSKSKINSIDQINLPTGDGEFNIWNTLAASHSFYPVAAYLSVSSAYNYRTQYRGFRFRDQLKFNIEAGYKLLDKVWLNGIVSAQTSVGRPTGTTDFVRGEGTEYTAVSFGAAYEFIKYWSLSLQAWSYADFVFDRKNIYSSPTYSIGVFYEIK